MLASKIKAKILRVISISLVLLVVSCSENTAKENQESQVTNKTQVPDSIYFFMGLNSIDSLKGFQEFLADSAVLQMVIDDYANVKIPDSVNYFDDTSVYAAAQFFFLRCWIKSTYLDKYRNGIILRRKGPIWKCARKDGTLSTDWLLLREDSTFDIHATSWMRNQLYGGTYTISSDTIRLKFTTEKPQYVLESYLLSKKYLSSFGEMKPRESKSTFFIQDCSEPKK